ncbi:MAG: MBL fold metallo-hydrolase [Chloroflexi bacterium]|nr:MBL fold metallo-hydrolase [Chloroflexota bacterium]
MQIQLIRNATLRVRYANRLFIIDPDLGAIHAREPLAGISRNPTVALPRTPEEILDGIEMIIVSHLHQDHFDETAQTLLLKDLQLFCQPGDEGKIKEMGFQVVTPIEQDVEWQGITISRTPGQHGSAVWAERLGNVAGFTFHAQGEPTVYWAGDTIWYPAVKETLERVQPDIIITHSGGAQLEQGEPIVMDGEQTLALSEAVPETTVVAVHLEALDHCIVSREELRAAAEQAGSQARIMIPDDGELMEY